MTSVTYILCVADSAFLISCMSETGAQIEVSTGLCHRVSNLQQKPPPPPSHTHPHPPYMSTCSRCSHTHTDTFKPCSGVWTGQTIHHFWKTTQTSKQGTDKGQSGSQSCSLSSFDFHHLLLKV